MGVDRGRCIALSDVCSGTHRQARGDLDLALGTPSALGFEHWQIEQPVTVGGKRYVVDAVNRRTGRIREFVHSISPFYLAKHSDLAEKARFDVRWIIDGHAFASRRQIHLRENGIKRLLRPRAFLLAEKLGANVRVHYAGQLWRHWERNIWYPDQHADAVVDAFVSVDRDGGKKVRP